MRRTDSEGNVDAIACTSAAAPLVSMHSAPQDGDLERVLARVSERMANLSWPDFHDDVQSCLEGILEAFGYDRCTLSEFVAGDYLHVVCCASANGFPALELGRFRFRLPWFLAQLRAGNTVLLPNLPDDLPAEANEEADHCRGQGLKSHLSIPLRVGGRVWGVLSFAAVHHARGWSPEVAAKLKTVGEVLAGAVALARAQEEMRLLRQKAWHADRVGHMSVLTAAIAHDLNQPLAAILSNAQAGLKYLARSDASPQLIQEVLEAVVREEKRAANTIRTMRAMVRRDGTRRERFALSAAVDDVLGLLSSDFLGKGIRIRTRLEDTCDVLADRTQIEQLLLNLLLNAAAAVSTLPPERRVVWVEVASVQSGRVHVAVRDSGNGIATQDLETIFEPFWTTREEGLGLGLAICRSIVESHSGRIWAEASAPSGATFKFELAEAPAAPAPSPRRSRDPDFPRDFGALSQCGRSTVCLIDDERSVRDGLTRLLTIAGFNVVEFSSADAFVQNPPGQVDCIVLDIRMPGRSGLELFSGLGGMGYDCPVIFLTGHGDVVTGVDAIKSGAADFLEKPVEEGVLVSTVQRALQRDAASRARERARVEARKKVECLSPRERQILIEVVRGRLNKQIAADLLITEQTVKQHRGRVMEKMGVRSVAELVRVCDAVPLVEEEVQRTNVG